MGIKAEQAIAERIAQEGFARLEQEFVTFQILTRDPNVREMLYQLYMSAFYAGANHGLLMSERMISDELKLRNEEPPEWS